MEKRGGARRGEIRVGRRLSFVKFVFRANSLGERGAISSVMLKARLPLGLHDRESAQFRTGTKPRVSPRGRFCHRHRCAGAGGAVVAAARRHAAWRHHRDHVLVRRRGGAADEAVHRARPFRRRHRARRRNRASARRLRLGVLDAVRRRCLRRSMAEPRRQERAYRGAAGGDGAGDRRGHAGHLVAGSTRSWWGRLPSPCWCGLPTTPCSARCQRHRCRRDQWSRKATGSGFASPRPTPPPQR